MIKNDLQYRLTQKQVVLFQKALADVLVHPVPFLLEQTTWVEALSSQLEDLEQQVAVYEHSLSLHEE